MPDWITGKVVKVHNWTDALFSLTVHAPVQPFTAGQFAKLALDIDGERVQRAYSYYKGFPEQSTPVFNFCLFINERQGIRLRYYKRSC